MHTLMVSSEETHLRLDKLLALRFPDYSRTYFQSLIEQGDVLVNGIALKKRISPKESDVISLYFTPRPELSLEPENIPLEILYEDEHLLVINKPAGKVIHPAPGHPQGTIANALVFHCQTLAGTDSLRPGIVHRLDKDTSGALLMAKHPQAHAKLVTLFSQRKIEKYYLAICVGRPKEGLIDAAIRRHPTRRKEMAVDLAEGKEAKSSCRVLGYDSSLSLVEIQLLTGRTHQIRVHMKYLGCPVLGDTVYGFPSANQRFHPPRQCLHALRLSFIHPFTQHKIECLAPIPEDFSPYAHLSSEEKTRSLFTAGRIL